MKDWMKIAAACVFALSVAACNTMEGIGRDLGEAGDAIEDAATDD